ASAPSRATIAPHLINTAGRFFHHAHNPTVTPAHSNTRITALYRTLINPTPSATMANATAHNITPRRNAAGQSAAHPCTSANAAKSSAAILGPMIFGLLISPGLHATTTPHVPNS